MELLANEHIELLERLTEASVDFILIGGYSVVYYGYSRTTNDMDLWLKPDNLNKIKFLNAMKNYGIHQSDLSRLEQIDFRQTNMFFVGKEPVKVDFLTHVVGVNWDEAIKKVAFLSVKNFRIPVVDYDDLITMKMLSSRLKDKADVEELQKINKYKKI